MSVASDRKGAALILFNTFPFSFFLGTVPLNAPDRRRARQNGAGEKKQGPFARVWTGLSLAPVRRGRSGRGNANRKAASRRFRCGKRHIASMETRNAAHDGETKP